MAKISGNTNLHKAKTGKNDEFYTQLADIEKELSHYKDHFKDKVVFCNCDDPQESNFYFYFAQNFEYLGLKKLIATHYRDDRATYKLEIIADINEDGKINKLDTIQTPLTQNGDFRSPECIQLLKQADIVVTNPPFSLFPEYIAQLIEYDKKFLILGNMNAMTYKGIFPLIKNNKIWAGYGFNMSMVYKTPYENTLEANKKFVIQKGYDPKYHIKVPAVNRYTNLDITKRHEELILYKIYYGNENEYPKYETIDGIDVGDIANIPMDYKGIMGVPKTFLGFYNPEQFEIIGYEREDENIKSGIKNMPESFLADYRANGGTGHYTKGMKMLCFYKDGKPKIPFSRILIKNKKL